jgi:hypothetical protein
MSSIQQPAVAFTSSSVACERFSQALAIVLYDLDTVLANLTTELYVKPSSARFMNASIGGHARHVLDHIAAIVDARADARCDARTPSRVDYDHRHRGTPVETMPHAARIELARLLTELERFEGAGEQVVVSIMPQAGQACCELASTYERELAFALSHTIHHCAMIRGMMAELDLPTPARFGFAPSTIEQKNLHR